MLSEKNLLKPLSEEFLIKRLDFSAVNPEKVKVPLMACILKNKEGKNVIFDNTFSIEVDFEEENLENFLEISKFAQVSLQQQLVFRFSFLFQPDS